MYVGQRVATKIDSYFYIGVITRKGSAGCNIDLDCNTKIYSLYEKIHTVLEFNDEPNRKEFTDLTLTYLSPLEVFSTDEDIEFGIATLNGVWEYINYYVFDHILSRPKIQRSNLNSYARYIANYDNNGIVVEGTARILISEKVRRPIEVLTTMAHEMVHQYQSTIEHKQVSGPDAHDHSFFRWSNKIRKVLKIELTQKGAFMDTEYKEYLVPNSWYVLLELADGKYSGTCSKHMDILINVVYGRKSGKFKICKTNDINVCNMIDNGELNKAALNTLLKSTVLDFNRD